MRSVIKYLLKTKTRRITNRINKQNVKFMRKLKLFLTCLLMASISLMSAQTKTASGTVVSAEDGQPVIGASVVVKGQPRIGVITDANGNYSLSVPTSANTLVIALVGMETVEVPALPNQRVNMSTDVEELEEVMVVAFGTAKKSAYTGSAKVVDAEQLANSQVTSVTNALAGAVPGLQITSDSGSPSSTGSIKIRGFSSINAGNDPLIIVDGAPYSGDMTNLNPNDVESMTVLKDAASNALYGARGANGVIMITTKKAAKKGDAVITLDAKWGSNTRALQRYNVITNPAQYYEMHYGALKNYYMDQGMSAYQSWKKS